MTLDEKIRMCDQMIREDKDSTVKDFIETLNEVEGIESTETNHLIRSATEIFKQTRIKQPPLHATKY